MITRIIEYFRNNPRPWPKIDSCSEVQAFIDEMCMEFGVPPIHVIVKSNNWIEWFAGKGVIACAFWPDGGASNERYIAFDGQTCRISGNNRNIPIKIETRWEVVQRIHTVIHEFVHHYIVHHYGSNEPYHGKTFREMERKINSIYGVYFVYSGDYGGWFHNFWGVPFGYSKPTMKDRGWSQSAKR
jgi:hypothetical protein